MQDMLALQEEFARAFRDARARHRTGVATPSYVPPVDVVATPDAYRIDCDLPGATRQDIRVIADGGSITISGVRRPPESGIARSERRLGSFGRLVPLPSDADLAQTSASFTDGVLHIRVGRRAPSPSGPIRIEIGD